MLPIADIPESLLHDIPIPKSKLRLSIASGYTKYIVNPTDIEQILEAGKIIAQFYKGKWVSEVDDDMQQIPFALTSSDDQVHCWINDNGSVMTN